jgi:exodeoxyribonuclease VII small subunit
MSKQSNSIARKQAELEKLLAWFESDDFSLEQAMEQFEKAQKLAAEIERELMEYKNTFTAVQQKFDEVGE